MLYETASRASAVLALNVTDCDFDNRRATVTADRAQHADPRRATGTCAPKPGALVWATTAPGC